MSIKVGIIGATGYAGVELLRLLLSHPEVSIAALSSVSFEGKPISEVYPAFFSLCDTTLLSEDAVIEKSDVVFASLPHGLSEPLAEKVLSGGKLFIDLGADFRLSKESDYTQWYGLPYKLPKLHKSAVYGLSELFSESIRGARLIANPGCYPTSIALGLAPALKAGLLDTGSIVIDSKSGVTGAGRSLSQNTHYPDCNETFAPYKIAEHRHTPEIEETLSILSGSAVKVTFVPHLLPVNRGIVSTIYATLKGSGENLHTLYCDFYKERPFVRVLEPGKIAGIKNVRCSNYCDISLHLDPRTNRLIVVSTIDNMVKGAAGQAIQNMNLALSLPETTGLLAVPPSF